MTLGVLAPYRRLGLGKNIVVIAYLQSGGMMLEHVVERAKEDMAKLAYIYLHVQTSNQEARQFYEKRGFQVVETIDNYYARNTDVTSAWLLRYNLQ
jgi:ribosomal protein S18 acetylase RimI-like enzyme